MAPVWFDIGYRITAVAYKNILASRILLWVKKMTIGTDYIFQQDGAPTQTANSVQEWLKTNINFWKDFWPPQSPDLNPLDYSIWWHIQNRACKVCHSNTEEYSVNHA